MAIQVNPSAKYIIKAVLFCVVFTAVLIVFSFAKSIITPDHERIAHGIAGTLAALFTTMIFLKFDRKKFSDIGLSFEKNTVVRFFAGVIIGVVLMGLLATSVIYFTHMEIEINTGINIWHFLVATAPILPLAFMEELAFRAYPLQILKDKAGIRTAIFITSILFALYHFVNGWSLASCFSGPGIWGLIFGLSAVYSRGIAMPTGIHYAVNLTTSAFGANAYGVSIWNVKQSPNPATGNGMIDWATLLPSLALLVFAIICIEVYVRRKTNSNKGLEAVGRAK
jgi:membrane protease YdiL (CAAX protease family)